MIRKLQIKFIMITMLATMIISSAILVLILVDNYNNFNRQADAILRVISKNEGKIPENFEPSEHERDYFSKETRFSTRFFVVETSDSGEIINMDLNNIAMVSSDNISSILKSIDNDSGFYENFKYKVIEKKDGKVIVFLDCSMQLNSIKKTTRNSIVIVGGAWLFVLIIASILSKRLLKPIIESIEKQKQFITNASHEFKTPLAVITSDLDILELTIGEENEWIQSIKNQVERLSILVKSLLNLANVQEGKNKLDITCFSLTDIIIQEINNFKLLAQDKKIVFDDSENININGDQNLIKQLIVILLDNAIKYTPKGGTIKINTEIQGKQTKFEVCNDNDNLKNINTKRLFDRFYRDDKSRNKEKEGYGIGLSIAKAIADVHKGKINVYVNNEQMICFRVLI